MLGGAGTVCGRAAGALINALRLAESFDMVRILRESGIDLVMFGDESFRRQFEAPRLVRTRGPASKTASRYPALR